MLELNEKNFENEFEEKVHERWYLYTIFSGEIVNGAFQKKPVKRWSTLETIKTLLCD